MAKGEKRTKGDTNRTNSDNNNSTNNSSRFRFVPPYTRGQSAGGSTKRTRKAEPEEERGDHRSTDVAAEDTSDFLFCDEDDGDNGDGANGDKRGVVPAEVADRAPSACSGDQSGDHSNKTNAKKASAERRRKTGRQSQTESSGMNKSGITGVVSLSKRRMTTSGSRGQHHHTPFLRTMDRLRAELDHIRQRQKSLKKSLQEQSKSARRHSHRPPTPPPPRHLLLLPVTTITTPSPSTPTPVSFFMAESESGDATAAAVVMTSSENPVTSSEGVTMSSSSCLLQPSKKKRTRDASRRLEMLLAK